MPRKKNPKGGERVVIQTRTTKELHQKLVEASAASGRSLAYEIETRLAGSFRETEFLKAVFQRADTVSLVQAVGVHVNALQDLTKRSWSDDADTRRKILQLVHEVLAAQFDAVDAPIAPHETFHQIEVRRAKYLSWYVQSIAREPAPAAEPKAGASIKDASGKVWYGGHIPPELLVAPAAPAESPKRVRRKQKAPADG
jgi:hypothetical protein